MSADPRAAAPWAGASQAILIGTSVHEDDGLPDLPAAANSVMALRSVLTDPRLCGWPAANVSVLHNQGDSRLVAQQIRRSARETTGVLLLYFVGHGMLTAEGALCLALADTVAEDPDLTGLEYSHVRSALRSSPAAVKIAILDCCYAGTVIQSEALSTHVSLIADQSDVRGVYTLTASDLAAHVARFDDQLDVCTSFTGELLHLVRGGLPGEPDPLTLGVLYGHLRHRLRAQGLPDPNQRGTDNAHSFPFTRNAARSATRPPAAPSPAPAVAAGRISKGQTFAPARRLGWTWWLLSLLPLALTIAFPLLILNLLTPLILGSAELRLLVVEVAGFLISFRLFVIMVQRGSQHMSRRRARLLIVNAAGIEVRVGDQRWFYRWTDVARITERRRNLHHYICLDLKPSAVLPPAKPSEDLSPWYHPGRGEVLLTRLSGYRAGRQEIIDEIARCAGPKWLES
ncbi:caspase family protein [Nonomuraea sp. NPDC002799]